MTIIDLKPVRRCGQCNHLIPASMTDCPYCSKRAFTQNTPNESEEEPAFEMKPLSPKAKKGILFGGIALVAVIAIVLIVQAIANMFVLNKSIMEPLDNSTVMSQIEKDPSFSQFYSEVSRLRDYITSEEDKTKYEDITYNDFREFYNSYSSEVYCDEIKQQADGEYDEKMMTPMNARVDSVKEVWTKFIDEHAIEKYITITTHNMFYGSPGSYHPAWYYIINNPGKVADCEADVVFPRFWNDITLHYNLEQMKEMSSADNVNYLTNEYAYGDDYWSSHEVKINIKSITLSNGTIITADDINQVPASVNSFLQEDNEYTRLSLIHETIDDEFPSRPDYQTKIVIDKLTEKYEHCMELIRRVETSAGYIFVTRGF